MFPLAFQNATTQNAAGCARFHVSEIQALDAWTHLLLAARMDELRSCGASLKVGEAQALALENVIVLQRFGHRLRLLAAALPRAENEEEMHEEEVPKDVATELAGTIQFVLTEHVGPAIEYLSEASRVTDEDLRRQFRRQQAKYEAWAKRAEREADEEARREAGREAAGGAPSGPRRLDDETPSEETGSEKPASEKTVSEKPDRP
jgi:hypothetical protein